MSTKVTSALFQKSVGRYQDEAQAGPVWITKNGRDHTVLISAREYRRLVSTTSDTAPNETGSEAGGATPLLDDATPLSTVPPTVHAVPKSPNKL